MRFGMDLTDGFKTQSVDWFRMWTGSTFSRLRFFTAERIILEFESYCSVRFSNRKPIHLTFDLN